MDPFAAALAVLFQAPGSAAAVYRTSSGEALGIRVIWAQGSQDGGGSMDRRVADTNSFDVRRVDVAQPARGETIAVTDPVSGDALTLRINGPAMLDVEGMTWTCPTEPV